MRMGKNRVTKDSATRARGFTLVETAFLIIIGSSVLTAILTNLNSYIQEQKYKATQEKMAMIDESIKRYLEEKKRLPCIASFASSVDSATFGIEMSTPDDEGCPPPPMPVGITRTPDNNVYIGMAPVRTLNLPDEFALDGWGSRITYAVTITRSRQASYESNSGAIRVFGNNDVTPLATGVDYILISHGSKNTGSYTISGSERGTCPASTLETENCDRDSIFRKALFVNINGSSENFDDLVVYPESTGADLKNLPARAVLPFKRDGKQNCPIGWTRFDPQPAGLNSNYVYCRKL